MKKIYEAPALEIEKFRIENIMTESDPSKDPNELPKETI